MKSNENSNADKKNLTSAQKKIIGKNISTSRDNAGLSQEVVSEGIGITVGFYSDIERGVKKPSIDKFVLIANILNESADVLFGEVLVNGYKILSSKLAEKMESLTSEQREEIEAIIEVMIKRNET